MNFLLILCFCTVLYGVSAARKRRQSETDVEFEQIRSDALSTICIFNCLEQHQRKGIDGPVTKPKPLENGCNNLDLRELVDTCKSFKQSSACIERCPNTETKSVVLNGLHYVCIERFNEFEKYLPCYNNHCPEVEEKCAASCGGLDEFQNELFSQFTMNETEFESDRNKFENEEIGRRKREKMESIDMQESSTPDPPDYTDPPKLEGIDLEGAHGGFLDVCKYLGCYVNCSRPIIERDCGAEAHQLLQYTARLLFAMVLTPFKMGFAGANLTQMINDGCIDMKFEPVAHKLTSGASTMFFPAYWSMLVIVAVIMMRMFHGGKL